MIQTKMSPSEFSIARADEGGKGAASYLPSYAALGSRFARLIYERKPLGKNHLAIETLFTGHALQILLVSAKRDLRVEAFHFEEPQ